MNVRPPVSKNNRSGFYKSALRLTHADITFFILPLLMANLVAGTLAQSSMGIYDAQNMFFSAFVTWAGPIPLPGGYTLLGIFTTSLFLKFILRSSWHRSKTGIILAHLGALVLLIGGLLTALSAREGYMIIPEGAQTPYIYDYHIRELFIFENDQLKHALAFDRLQPSKHLSLDLPFTTTVIDRCLNCDIGNREDAAAGNETPRDMARFMALAEAEPARENEENISGVSFNISGADQDDNGLYIAFEAMPNPIEISASGKSYKIIFGKQQRLLPFSIELIDFREEKHPGSMMAKSFSSDVIVHDGDLEWPSKISMNEPLRYKGYSFFQSSFDQGESGEITILSVVENKGQAFPYIGTLIIAAGLLLHLVMVLSRRQKP
jgi:hypothetical protein